MEWNRSTVMALNAITVFLGAITGVSSIKYKNQENDTNEEISLEQEEHTDGNL